MILLDSVGLGLNLASASSCAVLNIACTELMKEDVNFFNPSYVRASSRVVGPTSWTQHGPMVNPVLADIELISLT